MNTSVYRYVSQLQQKMLTNTPKCHALVWHKNSISRNKNNSINNNDDNIVYDAGSSIVVVVVD